MGPREYQESQGMANALRHGDNNTLHAWVSNVMHEPDAMNIIRNANNMAGHGRESMYVARDGSVVVQDNYTHQRFAIGRVQPGYEQPYGQDYYRQPPDYYQGQRPDYGARYGYDQQQYADRYGYDQQQAYGDRYGYQRQYAPDYVDPNYAYARPYRHEVNPAAMIGGVLGGLLGGFARPHYAYGGYGPYAYGGYGGDYYHHHYYRPNPVAGLFGLIAGAARSSYYY